MVVGAFANGSEQIGYARVISDKTRFAYITDVYIEEKFRKRGIGQKIINYILQHEELRDVYQWLSIVLCTLSQNLVPQNKLGDCNLKILSCTYI